MSTISRRIGKHLLLAGLGGLMALPFVWMVLTSLKPAAEAGTATWLPTRLEWGNYAEVFRQVPFARFYWNSLFIAGWVTFCQVFTSALAAYSFSRLRWPGRDKVFLLYLGTTMIPALVLIIPNYQIMIQLGLVDSYLGLILPSAFSAVGTFLLRQYMLTIPTSVDEAAEVDGASHWQIFWEIVLPLSRPGLVTLAILVFMANFHSFFWPLILIKSVDKYTLPVGMLYFDTTRGQATHLLMAAATMAVAPLIALFALLQKQIVRGIQLHRPRE
jgi:ABC-type glycerol-3-phosphate transport system permease component